MFSVVFSRCPNIPTKSEQRTAKLYALSTFFADNRLRHIKTILAVQSVNIYGFGSEFRFSKNFRILDEQTAFLHHGINEHHYFVGTRHDTDFEWFFPCSKTVEFAFYYLIGFRGDVYQRCLINQLSGKSVASFGYRKIMVGICRIRLPGTKSEITR